MKSNTVSARRKGDAVLKIRQDNLAKKIEIGKLNRAAEKLTGYLNAELEGKNIEQILPGRISETVKNYVDFSDVASDFASVARKVPNFQVLNKQGKEVAVSLKVFYMISPDVKKPEYELLMRDITMIKRMEELKKQIMATHKEEVIDNETGLASSNSVKDALDITYSFVEKDPIEVTFVIAAIDGLEGIEEQVGKPAMLNLIGKVGANIAKTCRDEDIVGHLGDGDIGMVLLDCNSENAESVLGRVYNNIVKNPIMLDNGRQLDISVSMVFSQLKKEYALVDIYEACRNAIIEAQEQGNSVLMEI